MVNFQPAVWTPGHARGGQHGEKIEAMNNTIRLNANERQEWAFIFRYQTLIHIRLNAIKIKDSGLFGESCRRTGKPEYLT